MKNPRRPHLPHRAAAVLARLRDVRGLDDGRKSLHALGLAASPEERWQLWERQIRSNGFWKPYGRRESPASSSECPPPSPKG